MAFIDTCTISNLNQRLRMLKQRLSDWLTTVWYSQSKPPAWLRALVPIYRYAQAREISSAQDKRGIKASIPVIVVGNLVVGGSGKTPVVACLVNALVQAGYKVAVIARGYGRGGHSSNRQDLILVAPDSEPRWVGDEPVLLAQQTSADVWVCQDRQRAVDRALATGAEVVVSDDGLQHPGLLSTYTLCLVDGERGFGNGYLLPAGPLRESLVRLDSVDQILIKAGEFDPNKPHSRFELAPKDLLYLSNGLSAGLKALEGQRVVGLCAIGHPESFRATLETLGMSVSLMDWPDHHAFSTKDVIQADQGLPIVVTEKDWVKIGRLDLPDALKQQIHILQVEAEVDHSVVDAVVAHVREFRHHG